MLPVKRALWIAGLFSLIVSVCLAAGESGGALSQEAISSEDSGAVLTALPEQNLELRGAIQRALATDPQMQPLQVQVDVYQNLAVLHGWVLDSQTRRAVEDFVRAEDGVGQVYNYIYADESNSLQKDLQLGEEVRVGLGDEWNPQINGLGRLSDVAGRRPIFSPDQTPSEQAMAPVVSAPSPLAIAVQDRLDADPMFVTQKLQADSYGGLIILHGTVPLEIDARNAQMLAAQTPGVEVVYSYLQTRESVRPEAEGTYCSVNVQPGAIPGRDPALQPKCIRYQPLQSSCSFEPSPCQ